MRTSARVLLFLSLALIPLSAQEPDRYGTVGVAAVIPTAKGKDETVRLATQVSDALRKEGNVTVSGDVQQIGEPTDLVVLRVAGATKLDWLALVRFDPKDDLHGVYSVEVVHIVAQRVASRVTALFGFIRTTQATLTTDLAREGSRAKDAVTALVTQLKRIWVVLNILTDPAEAEFVLGNTSNRTGKDGVGRWEGNLPPGVAKLRVVKQPGYAEKVINIMVPSTQCSPCFLPYQSIRLATKP